VELFIYIVGLALLSLNGIFNAFMLGVGCVLLFFSEFFDFMRRKIGSGPSPGLWQGVWMFLHFF
jgi:hypothetical protein